MAHIIPFKAIRAPRHLAHLVVTRPYYTYSNKVMEAKLESNRYSFLHIINPEFGLSDRHASNSTERFHKVFDKFNEFLNDGYLIQDAQPNLYIYRQSSASRIYTGVICGADVQEYDDDKIKKHEATLTSREEIFVKYLEITGFNAEPVLISHQSNEQIKTLLATLTQPRPEYEFTTTDTIKHELWLVDETNQTALIEAYKQIQALYIADGHHRSASSSRLAAQKRNEGCEASHPSQYFLSFLIDENELDIFPFHRVVHDLNDLKFDAFLERIQESFEVSKTELEQPRSDQEIVLIQGNQHYLLEVKQGKVDFTHPISGLSTQYLTDLILEPILNIQDQKTSSRIEFISGFYGIEATLKKHAMHPDGVAFILYPISVEQVRKVADNKLIMPPKSTWVEPKLRSGMTIYSFENDSQ